VRNRPPPVPFVLEKGHGGLRISNLRAFLSGEEMDFFNYRNGKLFVEEVDAARIAASAGTPVYVYSRRTIELHTNRLKEAFAPLSPLICYSIKANGNLAILKICVENGLGFDIVSRGELYRALAAGADASKIVYAGVGKTAAEIDQALDAGILLFNVESEAELAAINEIAGGRRRKAKVALRINPGVDPHTHRHLTTGVLDSKFGIAADAAVEIARRWRDFPNLDLVGVDMHLGSQITETEPYETAVDRLVAVMNKLAALGHRIEYFDIGGGFGIFYEGGEAKTAADFAATILPRLEGKGAKLILEPGRFIVGSAGVLLTRVVYVKWQAGKRFVICDAGMNDLMRPVLYDSYHRIWPVETHVPFTSDESDDAPLGDIVGPICESGDFFAKERPLPVVKHGQLLAIFSAGAYGMTMASNYNARPRAMEVLVDGSTWRSVRKRETYEDLIRGELDGAGG